jgi:hypothetical protein
MNALVVSLYTGYALYAIFPYTADLLKLGNTPDIKFAISLLIYIVAVSISQFILRRFTSSVFGRAGAMPLIIMALLTAGFVVALLYHVFGVTAVFNFPGIVNSVFAPNAFFFYWFIAPLAGLFFLA